MKNLEWPGIATAAVIMLILMIVFDLSKWQPLAAALIALGGGFLAYRGAMAKIDADRTKDEDELKRRKIGLYMRLRFVLARIEEEATAHCKIMQRRYYQAEDIRFSIDPTLLRFSHTMSELDEAWNNLDLLPPTVSYNLDQLRNTLRSDQEFLEGLPVIEDVVVVSYGHKLYPCLQANERLVKAAETIVDELDREITKLVRV